ncbi:aminoacetone oxidase family FAD-binding enzyme [Alphaproteobacteria bacterium GH1-50]|uniref:Aminoacetone oxidase family FAD-binding enzyme n=1 Tax=Kangsaoukella pontilimi TaxID=2691042 RepID=A0A7C9IMA8_9RHOB|nr:NAD(P)/FAD-dependent oxidoreductase [Kangsaoukella pontilimi]MXQ06550.1 aminoacetone oxidase family FAD-binding enzyme [Kangsaoukella pontilimi]
MKETRVDTLILGAGAAGMMCAAHSGGRTLVVDHAKAPGEKIRISGGGRCNFTNLHTAPDRFLSRNPHFAKSALSRYTQWDFLDLVQRHGIPWHEKTLGQLFCDDSARDIIDMLTDEMAKAGAELWLRTDIGEIAHRDGAFHVTLTREGRETQAVARNLVVATGGKSIPKMGATGRAYAIAEQFGLALTETRPALVPFTFGDSLADLKALSGLSVMGRATANGTVFDEAILFTHRGLSGPAILQASSYWREGDEITLDLAPGTDLGQWLSHEKKERGRRQIATVLEAHLPARLATEMMARMGGDARLADQSDKRLTEIGHALNAWTLKPTATEGYRTAEVTLGGIDTDALSSRTMMAQTVPGLYVIGEAVDVTGWLGGYNFQWAWSSGWAAGTAIREALG